MCFVVVCVKFFIAEHKLSNPVKLIFPWNPLDCTLQVSIGSYSSKDSSEVGSAVETSKGRIASKWEKAHCRCKNYRGVFRTPCEHHQYQSISSLEKDLPVSPVTTQVCVRDYIKRDIIISFNIYYKEPSKWKPKPGQWIEMVDALADEFEDLNTVQVPLDLLEMTELFRFNVDSTLLLNVAPKVDTTTRKSQNIILKLDFLDELKNLKVDYCKNCIFIHETVFYGKKPVSNSRYPKRKALFQKNPVQEVKETVFGALWFLGGAMISMENPEPEIIGKSSLSVNTTSCNFNQFLSDVMDELDKCSKRGSYLVMNNASIHKSKAIKKLITKRGYKVLYLPPASPDLNPMVKFWKLVKSSFRKDTQQDKIMATKISDAANSISINNIKTCIKDSVNCLQELEARRPL